MISEFSDKTVRMTFKAYDAGGLDAIKPKKRGRKVGEKSISRLNRGIFQQLADYDPERLQIKGCLWNRGRVREQIRRQCGIVRPFVRWEST